MAYSLYIAEQTSATVTPESFVMIVHQGDNREITMSRETRGRTAGSSFPTMLPSASEAREPCVGKPISTCQRKKEHNVLQWCLSMQTSNKVELKLVRSFARVEDGIDLEICIKEIKIGLR